MSELNRGIHGSPFNWTGSYMEGQFITVLESGHIFARRIGEESREISEAEFIEIVERDRARRAKVPGSRRNGHGKRE